MRKKSEKQGWRSAKEALKIWKERNETVNNTSPLEFNIVAREFLPSQASSASAERLFSDLGRTEGRHRQSMLSGTLETTETIRVFVELQISDSLMPQKGLLSSVSAAFTRTVQQVTRKVNQTRLDGK